jgi:hypothetical protein
VEKHVGRLQMDGNVVLDRALQGPGTRDGWNFEPLGRREICCRGQQIYSLFPGADWKIGQRLTSRFGVGLATTGTGSQAILKSQIEFAFGRKHN